jgi:SH3 domain-containing YSC84-like protein 1
MSSPLRIFIAALLLLTAAVPRLTAETDRQKQEARLRDAAQVMNDVLKMPDNIPQNILDKAKCIIVVPSVLKAAFIVGASYGRGAMVCRTESDFTGPWGAPSMMAIEGGSFGLQLGGQATDFVFLVMNARGVHSILHSKVKLGADISAAAGPVGRAAEADTDAYMRAELLSYSRSRGLFAGVSLEGSTLRPDDGANEALYGRKISARGIVLRAEVTAPRAAQRLISVLDQASPQAKRA